MAILQEIKVPLLAVNDSSLTVVELTLQQAQAVKTGEQLMVFETSKTTYEVIAEADGYIEYRAIAGNDYEVNTVVACIHDSVDAIPAVISTPASSLQPVASGLSPLSTHTPTPSRNFSALPASWSGDTLFSGAAAALMQQHGLGTEQFAGADFVGVADVEAKLGINKPAPAGSGPQKMAKPAAKSIPIDHSKVIVERLSSNKKREIEFLSSVQESGLTSTINAIVETDGIFVLLNQSLQYLKNSLLPLIVYETGRLLKKYPLLNAYYTGDGIAVYNDVNVGFAIDIEKGLKVLKIAQTNTQSLRDIEAQIMDLSGRYLDDTLQLDQLIDITFTITDLSGEGVAFFRPLVNMQNSAILGVSAIDEKLQRCTLSLTFDHHVTEGKYVARFLNELKERLESYRSAARQPVQEISCSRCYKKLSEDLSGTGFVKAVLTDGTEGYLCQSCIKGF